MHICVEPFTRRERVVPTSEITKVQATSHVSEFISSWRQTCSALRSWKYQQSSWTAKPDLGITRAVTVKFRRTYALWTR
ncbi:hypothetical protein VDGE_30775 [Verticillium dahliae]|uniref:Uncharacterized protein n=1 Tax=Verticillium dahliae TaxID=27337 RepID=A0A444S090_VERDA|nr:hypothetical protein VDGE_30775 [Verticillium dahliae]